MTADDMELDEGIYEQVQRLSAEGNDALGREDYDAAVQAFSAAYELLPEPKAIWEAAMWLQASLGDTYFLQGQYHKALAPFLNAHGSGSGAGNPFVALRLGECSYETDDLEQAKRYLLKAYMIEGDEIFASEDPKYLDLIRPEIRKSLPTPS